MQAFVDTNVPVAYSFKVDPFYNKSNIIFNYYSKIYWSSTVKDEFNGVFVKKLNRLLDYYDKYALFLSNNKENFFDCSLEEYIKKLPISFKDRETFITFWDEYVMDAFPSVEEVITAIEKFLEELESISIIRYGFLENNIICIPKRLKKFPALLVILHKFGVHYPDDEILLDVYDFANKCSVDFITFDDLCYRAANEIDDFSFHNVMGRFDFL